MNIVEPSDEDLTLIEAVQVIGLGAKTLRRAVQDSYLPRRYALGPRGPQLVFARAALTQWMNARHERLRSQRVAALATTASASAEWRETAASVRVTQLSQALEQSQATLERAVAALDRQQALVAELARTVTTLMLARGDAAAATRSTIRQGDEVAPTPA